MTNSEDRIWLLTGHIENLKMRIEAFSGNQTIANQYRDLLKEAELELQQLKEAN